MKDKNFFVYKYLNKNKEVIYIGQTINIRKRVWEHNGKNDKIQLEIDSIYYHKCKHKTEMDAYEYFLIRKYHPKYNVIFADEEICNIEDPEWILYNPKDFQVSGTLKRKKKAKKIICEETQQIYESGRDIERQLGIPHSNIYEVCSKKRKTAGGYHWRYLDEN